MLSCSIRFTAPSLWMGGGLERRCVGRVYPTRPAYNKKINLHHFCTRFLYSPSYDDDSVSILHHKTTRLVFLNDLGRK